MDFLLLTHDHGWEEFEGLCYFNLSSESENIHASIRKMKTLIGNIKQETEEWMNNIFKNWTLSGWEGSIVKSIVFFLVLFLILISEP